MKTEWIKLKCMQLKEWIEFKKYTFYRKLHKYVIKKEIEQFNKPVVYDKYNGCKLTEHNPNYWVFSPVEAVQLVIKSHFSFNDTNRFMRMRIFSISVDTQGETIAVNIHMKRPGYLIGSRGKDINAIENKLTEIFGVKTIIYIHEIKTDINEPFYYY